MPRSPSRDRSDRQTGNRAYVRDPDWLWSWKARATVGALVLVGAWLSFELAAPSRASSFHTHGELAGPHAAWDNDCAACHRPQEPSAFGIGSLFRARDRWHDLTCTKCHAGPAHHATVADGEFHNRCSNCHHDHGGRANSLTQISDAHCTHCHANLSAAHSGHSPGYAATIGDFAKDHPEFAVLRDYPPQKKDTSGRPYDRRRLKFSHALHMTPGLVAAAVPAEKKGTKDDPTWTPARIERLSGPVAAERYRGADQKPDDPVRLNCQSCHQLDAKVPAPDAPATDPTRLEFNRLQDALRGQPRAALLPPRPEGAHYLPVNYDAHCKACHPVQAPAGVSGGAVLEEFPLPHRKQPAELLETLSGEYAGRLARKNPVRAAKAGPGGRLDPRDPVVNAFGGEVDRLANAAMGSLLQGASPAGQTPPPVPSGSACGKCHYTAAPVTKLNEATIAPLPDRTVWFAHAKFNHVPHRGLTCGSCHPGTEPPQTPPGAVNETEPVLIWGVESCRACHSPTGTVVEHPNGQTVSSAGVRHRCTDCHRYHNNDHPLQGRGAAARDPQRPQELADFIGGGR